MEAWMLWIAVWLFAGPAAIAVWSLFAIVHVILHYGRDLALAWLANPWLSNQPRPRQLQRHRQSVPFPSA